MLHILLEVEDAQPLPEDHFFAVKKGKRAGQLPSNSTVTFSSQPAKVQRATTAYHLLQLVSIDLQKSCNLAAEAIMPASSAAAGKQVAGQADNQRLAPLKGLAKVGPSQNKDMATVLAHSAAGSAMHSSAEVGGDQITMEFSTGQNNTENVQGLLHLYRDTKAATRPGKEAKSTNKKLPERRSTLLCFVGVPSTFSVPDLLAFLSPVQTGVDYMRLLRDPLADSYLVLLQLQTQQQADQAFLEFNDQPYSILEPQKCHVMFVARVDAMHTQNMNMKLPYGLTELPCCAVCLERLDENATGILTTMCSHSFHCQCLKSWNYTSCPVCRHVQKPDKENECFACGSKQGLWICLICGNIGCGRYLDRHSYQHFLETQHTYAMELESRRVWDYVGDNYVHRLIQSTTDGKPIEVPSATAETEEKVDALTLEYTYLLTSQLESQRLFYTERENAALAESEALGQHVARLSSQLRTLQSRHDKLCKELETEKELGKSLAANQHHWEEVATQKDKEIAELHEQVRDLMFAFDAQRLVEQSNADDKEDIKEGKIILAPRPSSNGKTRKKKK